MAIFLSLGSNLGDKLKNILNALKELSNYGRILDISNIYETEAIGMEGEDFYNCVVKYRTYLPPHDLLRVVKEIEHDLGRDESQGHFEPRIIDIDILLYNDLVVEDPDLRIPHPALFERDFLLKGIMDIEDNLVIRSEGVRIRDFFNEHYKEKIFKLVSMGEKILEELMTF